MTRRTEASVSSGPPLGKEDYFAEALFFESVLSITPFAGIFTFVLAHVDPEISAMRSDPRFAELLRAVCLTS